MVFWASKWIPFDVEIGHSVSVCRSNNNICSSSKKISNLIIYKLNESGYQYFLIFYAAWFTLELFFCHFQYLQASKEAIEQYVNKLAIPKITL